MICILECECYLVYDRFTFSQHVGTVFSFAVFIIDHNKRFSQTGIGLAWTNAFAFGMCAFVAILAVVRFVCFHGGLVF